MGQATSVASVFSWVGFHVPSHHSRLATESAGTIAAAAIGAHVAAIASGGAVGSEVSVAARSVQTLLAAGAIRPGVAAGAVITEGAVAGTAIRLLAIAA